MSDKQTFAERIKRLRKEAGFTQSQLGNKAGVSVVTLCRWERGERQPRLEEIQRLAKALNVSEDKLLNGVPEATWVLTVKIADDFTQEVIDMSKKIPCVSSITTTPQGGFLSLGGDYSLWTDDVLFRNMINDMKKFRATVIQNGKALGGIKE